MKMTVVSQIMGIVEDIAPAYYKSEQDKIGLQVGNPAADVTKVLATLEITPGVIREAREKGAQLIFSHHPLIFQSLDRVLINDYIGGMVTTLIQSGISVLVAHTNLDRARDGVSDVLAAALGLEDIQVMLPAGDIQIFKLVVFVPAENINEMIAAVGNAGGGIIGDYSHCTFRAQGTGTFYPMVGAQPYLGSVGELNQVDEYRLEVLIAPNKVDRVVQAMLNTHSYEEPAFDIYEVKTPPSGVGFGRIGNLEKPHSLRQCIEKWSVVLDSELKVAGDWKITVKRVAVCGGSGGELMSVAKASGADVYVTGDIKHHAAHAALGMGLAIVDAGHAETERLVIPEVAKEIQRKIYEERLDVSVIVSEVNTIPWNKG
ncbi:MAG TPA: Nif3-like dinuclear metal center hexameric protein [Candidatus Aquicultor sp.]